MWFHLASWNLPNSQLCIESKTEPSVAKENYIWVDTTQKKGILEGGHRTLTLMRGTIGVGTQHNIEGKRLAVVGWVGRCA